jgi:hypothetical protein
MATTKQASLDFEAAKAARRQKKLTRKTSQGTRRVLVLDYATWDRLTANLVQPKNAQ